LTSDYGTSSFVEGWRNSPFATAELPAWLIVQQAESLIRNSLAQLGSEYRVENEFAVHHSATVEPNVVLKGPGIIGPRCLVATGSYLRGGIFLGEDCIIGPNSELKTSFLFPRSKIAHLSFVGDSVIGADVNIEAGAIIANYRNELTDKTIRIAFDGDVIDTGVTKFGALIGDGVRIGANAVVAPGALILPGVKVGRLQLFDQHPY
jgi:UDP-N-acetylglucosamine diphosphorylase / glucose-1-phosphate thymidylyltransferase / UDP-N-acetylgalactosamine diphosphorylase / glucosamine-1-phosphate N-acetyltransferase / galactosamine-1-phosphate N-acetyltransferase